MLEPAKRILHNLSAEMIEMIGVVELTLNLSKLKDKEFRVKLYVLEENICEADIILGREFLNNEKLTFVYKPANEEANRRVSLFTLLPLCIEEEKSRDSIEEILETVKIDFSPRDKHKLIEIILKVESLEIVPEHDYSVRVQLKDESIYAYAPR